MAGIEVKVFAESAAEQMKMYLPREYQDIECHVIEPKMNGVPHVGINVRMPGSDGSSTVYVESFFDEIRRGAPLEEVLKGIAKNVAEIMPDRVLPAGFDVKDYNSVKDYLRVTLVNTKANRAMLMEHPHMGMEDLSVVIKMELPRTEDGRQPEAGVSNKLASCWGIGKEELFLKAMENTIKEYPPALMEMNEAVYWQAGDVMPENLLEANQLPVTDCPMYVITNQRTYNGAVAMLYPEVLDRMCDLFSKGYYILPSSIHDLVIVPKNADMTPGELGEMVRDINKNMVEREEVLSDHIYEYDRDKRRLCRVPESMDKRREAER